MRTILVAVRQAAFAAALLVVMASTAAAYPNGTPDFQTDVAPYCAVCHASTAVADLGGVGAVAAERAGAELAGTKHHARILAGDGPYAELVPAQREQLVGLLEAVDRNSSIQLEFPAQVAPGQTFQVSVRVSGGAGPNVGVGLVDRAHRLYARPVSAAGWQVVATPTVIGPGGPQAAWLSRRPERAGRAISFVNIEGIQSSPEADKWSRAKVIFTLKAPQEPGDHPVVGVFFYGTETSTPLATRMHPQHGPMPLGGVGGSSGRVKFSAPGLIRVRAADATAPAAARALPPASTPVSPASSVPGPAAARPAPPAHSEVVVPAPRPQLDPPR